MAVTVLEEGFDSFTDWTIVGGGTSVVHRTGRTGLGLAIASSAGTAAYTIPGASESDTVTVGFAWRMLTLTGTRPVVALRSDTGATTHITLDVTTSGTLEVRRGTVSGTILVSHAAGIVTGTWYYLEVQVKLHDTTGVAILRLNGTQVGSTFNGDTKNAGTKSTFDQVFLTTGATNGQIWDDLYLVTGTDGAFRGSQTYEGTGPFVVNRENFSSGLGAWTVLDGSPTITGGRYGNGLQFPSPTAQVSLAIPAGQRSGFVVIGFAMHITAAPGGTTTLVEFWDGSFISYLRIGTDRSLNVSGVLAVTAAGVVPVGTWCYVEVSFLGNAIAADSAAEAEIRVNGVQQGYTRDSNVAATTTALSQIRIRGLGVSGVLTIDDLYVLTGTLADFEGDPGPPPSAVPVNVWDGSAFVDATALKVWNGTAFVDATALKVWNGSSFVDAV